MRRNPTSNEIRNAIRDYAYEHNLVFYNLRTNEGLLRHMMIRTSNTGDLMVLLQLRIENADDQKQQHAQINCMDSLLYLLQWLCF